MMCCNGAAYQPEFKFAPAGAFGRRQAVEKLDGAALVR